MVWSPRKKAFAFASVLILVSTVLLVSAAATTESVLRPFGAGKEFAKERALSRHGVALAVIVGSASDEGRSRTEGALVTILGPNGGTVASESTDAQGRALFQLRRGVHAITVTSGDDSATKRFDLQHSQRVFVVFDEAGEADWSEPKDHQQIERRGETNGLTVIARQNTTGTAGPAEGATVKVYTEGTRNEVANATTGPRGGAHFQLHRGGYLIVVTFDGQTGSTNVGLGKDKTVAFLFDDDGVHVRGGSQDSPPARRAAQDANVLSVRVIDGGENASAVQVSVYTLVKGRGDRMVRGDEVANGTTDRSGVVSLRVRDGGYEVVAQDDGREVFTRLRVNDDERVRLEFPEESSGRPQR